MNAIAIVVMLVAMILIWGGLVLSIIHLMKNPDAAIEDVKSN